MDLSKYIRFLLHYGFHPNVNFKNGSGNESQRAKDKAKIERKAEAQTVLNWVKKELTD